MTDIEYTTREITSTLADLEADPDCNNAPTWRAYLANKVRVLGMFMATDGAEGPVDLGVREDHLPADTPAEDLAAWRVWVHIAPRTS